MFYMYYGSDTGKVRENAYARFNSYVEKGYGSERINDGSYETGMLRDALGATSLFGEKRVVLVDMPSENKELNEEFFSLLGEMTESDTVFVCIEGELKAPERKKLEKHAKELSEFTGEKIERFNTFALADALVSRDKKKLWLLFNEAKESGVSAEEIIGTLFWQVKMMLLAAKTESASEAGQKPFVYSKAKRALSKYKVEEVEAMSGALVRTYHEGHLGKRDIDAALEEWILEI